MKHRGWLRSSRTLAMAGATMLLASCAWGQILPSYQTIYSFLGGADGAYPVGAPVLDSSGYLYGTTVSGGVNPQCPNPTGCGTVFRLTPYNGCCWTEAILLDTNFANSDPASGVILGPPGVLYGTSGGPTPVDNGGPIGASIAVFQVSGSNSTWSISDLFGFYGGLVSPSSLTRDSSGNLYGTTQSGGQYDIGYAFELSPGVNGWVPTILYNFGAQANDGSLAGPLVLDGSGNLYGVASKGGANGDGDVFELSQVDGVWQETILYSFGASSNDASFPTGSLAINTATGTLFGTTTLGGRNGSGALFELTNSDGSWSESILYNFDFKLKGLNPNGSPVLDTSGNLYGTTAGGGSLSCNINQSYCGVLYRLSPPAHPNLSMAWNYTALHYFTPNQTPGPLTIDGGGNIYGVTSGGDLGTVFKLIP